MEVRYKRDLNSNYMILTDQNFTEENHEVRMITENRIYGFLPCVRQKQEGHTEYYYEITGWQSMGILYERKKINCEQLRSLLRELEKILEAAKEYLLDLSHFVLKPEYMYLNAGLEKLYLCYYPGYEKEIRESFLEWAEYLLGKLDKSDAEGIEFGYDLYQCALEPNFSLLEVLQKHTHIETKTSVPAAEPKEEALAPVQEAPPERTGTWKNLFRKKGKEKKPKLEDYLAEADRLGSGEVLFLREQESMRGTECLQMQGTGSLLLKSCSPEYPDFHIREDSFLIGKQREHVDGCIPAATVSRMHARVTRADSVYYIEDLNSTNGTWVDQMQLDPYELFSLENGMRIVFANAEYEVFL